MKLTELAQNIYFIEDFWSAQQCDDFIAKTESIGYQPATIQTDNGPRLVDFIRNNNRVVYKDYDMASELWHLLKDIAPQEIGQSKAVGLNELFRFYKYQPGQLFKKHRDQSFIRNSSEASYFTFMIYLNDDFKGGATTFDHLEVSPKKGSALIFYHYLEHEGSEVIEGTKYVLRTDIMYKLKELT